MRSQGGGASLSLRSVRTSLAILRCPQGVSTLLLFSVNAIHVHTLGACCMCISLSKESQAEIYTDPEETRDISHWRPPWRSRKDIGLSRVWANSPVPHPPRQATLSLPV